MPPTDRHRLRTTFDEVAELYDRVRPAYPPELLDDLVVLAETPGGSRVLEIGCGTGQATVHLAERGFRIVCVELSEQLAALARRRLAGFSTVQVINAPFETWEPTEAGFDAVVAFTAWHWIDPDVRYAKPARLLREEGALAVVATKHVLPEHGDRFWAEVQEDYDAIVPSDENKPPPHPDDVPDLGSEIEASGCFSNVAVRRYLWDATYSADEYIAVLDTYSGHRALDEHTRTRLYDRIRRRIQARRNGRVRKTYLFTLNVARRL